MLDERGEAAMARKSDLNKLKADSNEYIDGLVKQIDWTEAKLKGPQDYLFLRWVYEMTAVELYASWERYAENRMIAALNHHPEHFITDNVLTGVKTVSRGFAEYVVRGGRPYFDFRSVEHLKGLATRLLGKPHNPFAGITSDQEKYLDALATIRNRTVHDSDAARIAYKAKLKQVYGINSAPQPEEFLHTYDSRNSSPARNQKRLFGLIEIVRQAIKTT
jgi:hypothetical protein